METPTREELNQAYYISKEIENLQTLIDKYSSVDIKAVSADGAPHSKTNTPGRPTEDAALQIVDLKEQLEQLQERCRQAKVRIVRYIMQIDDSRMRQIVTLRCLEYMQWDEIADCLGGNNTAITCRVAFYRWFNKH